MSKYMKPKPEPFDIQLHDAFKVLDKDGTGYITVSNLRHILTSIDEKLEPAEFDEWIREDALLFLLVWSLSVSTKPIKNLHQARQSFNTILRISVVIWLLQAGS